MSKADLGEVLPSLDRASASQVQRFSKRLSAASRIAESARVRQEAVESGHAEGYRAGYAAGFEAGQERGTRHAHDAAEARYADEIGRFVDGLEETGQAMLDAIQRWYGLAEESLAGLALVIAERVIAAELSTSKDAAVSIARDAIAEVTHATEARIRVHPFDSDAVRARASDLLMAAASLRSVEVVDDPAVPGGCVIETDGGVIDATIATKLRTILEATHRAA